MNTLLPQAARPLPLISCSADPPPSVPIADGCARLVLQMLQLLAPEGVLLQSSAAQVFCNRLLQEGTLPLAKVNLDAMDLTDSLTVSPLPNSSKSMQKSILKPPTGTLPV